MINCKEKYIYQKFVIASYTQKQDLFNKEANHKTGVFLLAEFIPCLNNDFSTLLNEPSSLYIDVFDPQTVNFAYPQIFEDAAILKVIRMEIGALAALKLISYRTKAYSQHQLIIEFKLL